MAELRGGTTIGGYVALHSGLKEAYLMGNLTLGGNIKLPSGGEIWGGYNNAYILKDHANGAVSINAAGDNLHLGYQNTTVIRLNANLYNTDGTLKIADTAGKLYYQGNDIDARYMKPATTAYVGTDLTGSTSYPRLVANNSGATSPDWIRVSTDVTGLLPYSTGNSFIGTSSWKFKEIHSVNFYENGTLLSSKYAVAGHNHDSIYVKTTGDAMTGLLTITNQGDGAELLRLNTERAWSFFQSGAGASAGLALKASNAGKYFRVQNLNGNPVFSVDVESTATDGAIFVNGTSTLTGNVNIAGTLSMSTNKITNVTEMHSTYGRVIQATDTWFRLNADGLHTAGTYFGSSIVRTDGELQVGNSGIYLKSNPTQTTIGGTSAMTLRLVGTDLSYNNNYIGFYQNNNTTRQGWIGFPTGTNSQLGITNDSGDINLNAGSGKIVSTNSFNIEIGRTKYYGGTASGGDSIYSPTGQLILGGNTNVVAWAETGVFSVRTGAVSASTVALSVTAVQSTFQGSLLIDNAADVDGANDKGLTLRDSSDNVITFDPNEMWIVGATNVRAPYTFNASYMQVNNGSGTKRIPRVSWGTAAPPATNVMDGDIYIQY